MTSPQENDNASQAPRHRGRLELTWTNKDRRLLAHEDGSYEWVEPSDYRVAEVRLLHDAGVVGEVEQSVKRRAGDNLLIRGNAAHALNSLAALPEFAREYVGKVKLAYIDPPFNTGQAFEQYDDALEHSVWLTMMRDTLLGIKPLLSPDGSVWVHLDDAEMAYCRVLMDELFGRDNFVAHIVWQGRHSRSSDAVFSVSHHHLLVYATNAQRWKGVRNRLAQVDLSDYSNPDNDPRGPWRSVSFSAPNRRKNLSYEIVAPNGKKHRPPDGRHWRMTEEKFRELLADERIYWGADGNGVPRVKQFASEARGLVPSTWWPHTEVGHSEEAKRELQKLFPDRSPFATPKPERLLERIVHIATDPGDRVLDCFAGSGTTAAVAHKMGRRWVTVEMSRDTVENYTLPRLKKVVAGEDPGGITESVGWKGGGGFRVLDVAPSMFDVDEDGFVTLADWLANGQLAEATAAQLGFEFEPDGVFCGRKGRFRLAVLDGLVYEDVVEMLTSALDESERLIVAGTAISDGVEAHLRQLRPGSRVRKIPQSILAAYQSEVRWHPKEAVA